MNTKNIKIYTLFAIIAMLCFTAMAQTKPKHVLAIAADKMNVLYAGIPNPVRVAVSSVAPEKLRIDWGGATATYIDIGRYDVSVPRSLVGRELVVTVRKGNKVLGSYNFRIKAVPEPSVFIGGNITAGCHPKDAILANPFISARMGSDFNYHLPWKVISYNVTFLRRDSTIEQPIFVENEDEMEDDDWDMLPDFDNLKSCWIIDPPIFVEGNFFSEEVINKIKDAPSSILIEFSDFKIQSIAGERDTERVITIRIADDCDADKTK